MKHRNESKKKRRPDHEAVGVEVSADTISDPEYFHRFEGDGGNRSKATGNIVVVIRRQHKGSVDKDVRPDNNEVLYGDGDDASVDIEARRIQKIRRVGKRANTTANGRVEIFGKLRRRP